MDPLKTGTIICEARKKLNMTQKDLADKLYVSDKAVSKWERGLCFPDISVLIPLTEVLGISLYDVLKGEKMNTREVDETLKNTITYSNNEVKKKKKKYIIISCIIIAIAIIISIISIFIVNKNNEIGGVVDRDTIHDISHYIDYKTSLENDSGEKIELVLMKLPLKWKERSYKVNNNSIDIVYGVSYNDVVKAYNDKNYVNLAMIDISTIIFTTIDGVDNISIKFNDYKYIINKEKLMNRYSISNFTELENKENWEKVVSEKLRDSKIVNDIFNKCFTKSKVSKD